MSQSIAEQGILTEDRKEGADPVEAGLADAHKMVNRSEREEDLLCGQPVIVTARWIFVVSGLVLALWNAETVGSLKLQLIVIFLLAVANFYVHIQLLTGKPVKNHVVYISSAADLLLISILILFQGGYDSSLYVFYFPAIVALSVAFSTQLTTEYTAGVMAAYATISLVSGGDILITIIRLLMIAAVAYCGNRYWQIERSRRHAAVKAQEELIQEIERQSLVVD